MGRRQTPAANHLPRFLTADDWAGVVKSLALAPRQAEIVLLILQARQQKEIARELGLSPHTVRAYMRQILANLGVANQTELVLALAARRTRVDTPIYSHSAPPAKGSQGVGRDVEQLQ